MEKQTKKKTLTGVKYLDTLFNAVEAGKKGERKGINIPGKILKAYIPNIQRRYFLVLSNSGVGKTSFTHYLFLFTPFMQWYNGNLEDLEIHYFTNEMTIEEIVGQFICFLYHNETNKIADLNTLYSQGDNQITEELEKFINKDETKEIISLFQQKVEILSEKLTSGFIYKRIQTIANDNGEIVTGSTEDGTKYFVEYNRYNDNKEVIFIVDNFTKLMPSGKERTKKDAIDKTSIYLDTARYRFGFITVGLQQVNRNTSQIEKFKMNEYFPTEKDAKESENPFHDAQVVFSQISPYKDGLEKFGEISIKDFKDRLRVIKIIKNRGGIAFKTIPYVFLGEFSKYIEFDIKDLESITKKVKKIAK